MSKPVGRDHERGHQEVTHPLGNDINKFERVQRDDPKRTSLDDGGTRPTHQPEVSNLDPCSLVLSYIGDLQGGDIINHHEGQPQ